ncbi:MAG: thioesterase domain-containing protein [Bacillota bacterium]|nr:thioesterase domain-containing protein [Bacillota bacterium]
MNKIKLFCFPYAGGSASIYTRWKKLIGDSILFYPIELSGHGKRIMEAPYKEFNDIINDMLNTISKEDIDNSSYAFFGHSMGALIVYELTMRIYKENIKGPKQVFISGMSIPENNFYFKNIHLLSENELLNELVKLGGIPQEVLENHNLIRVFTPIFKNDFRLLNYYLNERHQDKFKCDLTVFYGSEDIIQEQDILQWQNYTEKSSSFYKLNGGHFFINKQFQDITKIINGILNNGLQVK